MSKYKDTKTVVCYDPDRENPARNAVEFLRYKEEG